MNAKHEQSAEKKALADTLLAIDSRMPTSSAEGREVVKEVLRRDRRRVRILTWATIGLFLLMVIGICGGVYWYYVKVVPEMNGLHRSLVELYSQISKVEPQPSKPGPLAETALLAAGQCYVVFVAEGMFCDFAKFRRLAFYGPTEFIASRWARHAV